MPVPLSVLDLVPIGRSRTAAEALRDTTVLAQRAEELGYRRFWVAEHHNIPSVGSTAPEVLIAHLAALTRRIRVGSGGVMLTNHAPLAVAERFGMLEALHPGRIDLGLGRAPGTDMRTAMALRSADPHEFVAHFTELRGHLGTGYAGMRAVSGEHTLPELWMLGSTDGGARIAGSLGLPFVFAHHFNPHLTEDALALYRSLFQPSASLAHPRVIVAAAALVGENDDEAARLVLPAGVAMLRLRQGRPQPIPTVAEAEALIPQLSPAQRAAVEEVTGRVIAGGPATVERELQDLIARTGADEVMVTSQAPDVATRIESLEQLAGMFELVPAPVPG